jgi:hypothetical protein
MQTVLIKDLALHIKDLITDLLLLNMHGLTLSKIFVVESFSQAMFSLPGSAWYASNTPPQDELSVRDFSQFPDSASV